MAVLAPIPRASDRTASVVNPGLPQSIRNPCFKSRKKKSIWGYMLAFHNPGLVIGISTGAIFSVTALRQLYSLHFHPLAQLTASNPPPPLVQSAYEAAEASGTGILACVGF